MMERPRITLQTLRVLTVLLNGPAHEHYGLEISKAAGVATGSIYPILARLERAGWVESGLEDIDEATEGRPKRRYYQLTPTGAQRARRAVLDARHQLALEPASPSQDPAPELDPKPPSGRLRPRESPA